MIGRALVTRASPYVWLCVSYVLHHQCWFLASYSGLIVSLHQNCVVKLHGSDVLLVIETWISFVLEHDYSMLGFQRQRHDQHAYVHGVVYSCVPVRVVPGVG